MKIDNIYKAAMSLCVSVCLSAPPPPFRHDRQTTTKFGTNKCRLIWELFEPKESVKASKLEGGSGTEGRKEGIRAKQGNQLSGSYT